MAMLTLGKVARMMGRGKTTLARSIRAGRLSAATGRSAPRHETAEATLRFALVEERLAELKLADMREQRDWGRSMAAILFDAPAAA